jgi:hypothetical protein
VASPALAATLIESWMRPDLTGPLLAARPMPSAQEPTVAAAPVPPAPAASTVSFVVMGESGVASEGSVWMGASAAARSGWGTFRIGPRARFTSQTVASRSQLAVYEENQDADLDRLAAELLVEAERPFAVGAVWLTPGLGAGARWLRTRASHEEQQTVASAINPIAEARLTLTVPLGGRLGLDLAVGLVVAGPRGAAVQDDFTLPAAPAGQLRAGLGLRYGRP